MSVLILLAVSLFQVSLAQETPPLTRTVIYTAKVLTDASSIDSFDVIFPRLATGGYPVVLGNLGLAFKTTVTTGDEDSLTAWLRPLRRLTSSTYFISVNDSFNIFQELDWTTGVWYAWPTYISTPISYGPCDGVRVYMRYTDTGVGSDGVTVIPYSIVQ